MITGFFVTALDVGAGDVHLEPADLLLTVELFAGVGVFVNGKSADIRHNFFVKAFFEPRELLAYNLVHSGILEPDGVYHAGGALRYSRCRIAETRLFRRTLERKSSEAVYVIELSKFVSVAECARCRDNGIVELFAAKIYAQSAHIISSLSITGPSLQILLLPVSVLHEQPMHAPKPQPMRSSKLYCPGVFMILCIARNIGSGPQV